MYQYLNSPIYILLVRSYKNSMCHQKLCLQINYVNTVTEVYRMTRLLYTRTNKRPCVCFQMHFPNLFWNRNPIANESNVWSLSRLSHLNMISIWPYITVFTSYIEFGFYDTIGYKLIEGVLVWSCLNIKKRNDWLLGFYNPGTRLRKKRNLISWRKHILFRLTEVALLSSQDKF